MKPRRLGRILALASLAAILAFPSIATAQAARQSAIIGNGTVQLGVWDLGNLNVPGGVPSPVEGTSTVGLRYLPTGYESISPGCACEGWGAADATSGISGYANESSGTSNLTLVSFTSGPDTATSVVDIGQTLRVTHAYQPSPATPNLFQVTVTIENLNSAPADVRYRRVMDWDVEPTPYAEHVTIHAGNASELVFTSNDGFASANPLAGPSDGGLTGSFTDAGPDDHGALFDFNLGSLGPGASTTFKTYYGAAGTEADANDALAAVGAEAFSFGQSRAPEGDPVLGTPTTFIFGFGGIGGTPISFTSITGGPSGLTNDRTPTFTFTSDDPEPSYECSIDGGAFSPCSSPHTTASLADGTHTFTVQLSGHANTRSASRTFTVDATAPDTSITGGPTGTTSDTTPTFSFTSDDSGATFQCSLDGGSYGDCTSPHTTGPLADGSHVFRVRAVDEAGNRDGSPAVRSFTVDTAPPPPPAPTLTLTPPSASRTVGESHSVLAHAEHASGTVYFTVTGAHAVNGSTATNAAGDALFSYPGSSAGDDTIAAFLDRNGNGARDAGEPQSTATITWSAPEQNPPQDENQLPPNIPTANSIDELPNPQPYRNTNVQPTGRGEVYVQLPRSSSSQVSAAALRKAQAQGAPKGFIPLRQAAQLPLGSTIEAGKGKVLIESTATNSSRRTQRAEFFDGRFLMTQKALGRRSRPVTEMVLKGGTFRGCPSTRSGKSSADADSSARRRTARSRVRRVWGRGRGRFRTRGRYSSATVRGTTWLVEDRCGGTLTRLPRRPRTSRVEVRDFGAKRTVQLRAGQSYLARAKAPRRRSK